MILDNLKIVSFILFKIKFILLSTLFLKYSSIFALLLLQRNIN